tara:strand:- start:168 stop:338 length:171 start_codon:yes stop_codon:yes gene_type:complete
MELACGRLETADLCSSNDRSKFASDINTSPVVVPVQQHLRSQSSTTIATYRDNFRE